jgi:acetate kinase
MTLLIANPGSTSFKCKLYDMATLRVLFQANVERIGDKEGIYSFSCAGEEKTVIRQTVPDYPCAVNLTLTSMKEAHLIDDLAAVGFKTVHAKGVTGCVELSDSVLKSMEEYRSLDRKSVV